MAKVVLATDKKKQGTSKTIKAIVTGGKELLPGQKVLIYTTTDSNIVSSTGRIIGKKESIIGTGIVSIQDNKLVVCSRKLNATIYPVTQNDTSASANPYRSFHGKYGWRKNRLRKLSTIPNGDSILVKPIEE